VRGRVARGAAAALAAACLGPTPLAAATPDSWVEHDVAYGVSAGPQCPQQAVHERCVADNGVNVDIPKLYDNRTLQRSLAALSAQLGGVAGVDQASLLSRIANVTGGSLSQTAFNLQLAGAPLPGVTTTNTALTPQIAQTNGLVSNTAPSGPTSQTTNQTITTTPSNTLQTQTTQPTFSPTLPALPSASALATPSNVGPNALGTLAREMELNYQIFGLQLLLQGSLGDDYSVHGFAKRHVTLGFPIEIDSAGHNGQVAQVEVSVCNPAKRLDDTPPSIQTLLPQKRSYDVVSVTNHTTGLGAGAIVSAVSLGASFLWSHQTFYLVQDQDTVALQTESGATRWARCPAVSVDPGPTPVGGEPQSTPSPMTPPELQVASQPVTFAWRFLPVLGHTSVESGDTTTFAQVALAPSRIPPHGSADRPYEMQVSIQTCWYDYDAKSGVVRGRVRNSCTPVVSRLVPTVFDTTGIDHVTATDNGDGTLNVRADGVFPYGSAVEVGDTVIPIVDQVVERDATYLRFTVAVQAAATHELRIVSPDGGQQDVVLQSPSIDGCDTYASRTPPSPVVTSTFNDTLTELTIDYPYCAGADLKLAAAYPPVVVLGGKAYGMSDAPFESFDGRTIRLSVPTTGLQGQSSLTVKRLFLGPNYEVPYAIDPSRSANASLSVLNSDKTETTYLGTGTLLRRVKITDPAGISITHRGERLIIFKVPATDKVQAFIFQIGDDPNSYFSVAVPGAGGGKSGGDDTAQATLTPQPLALGSNAAISIGGSNLSLVNEIDYLGKPLAFLRTSGTAMTVAQPSGLSGAAGVSTFKVVFKDGSSEPMDITVK
jgi:hypothetical protein